MLPFLRIGVVLAVAVAVAGCSEWFAPQSKGLLAPKDGANPGGGVTYLRDTSVKSETGSEGGGAVEDALKWSEKYSRVIEELVRTQQQKQQVEDQNRKAAADLAKLHADMEQYKKELGEANTMMLEMRQELDKWKSNVLGFRDEMRKAQTAQLDALRKILELLGGEAPKLTGQPTTQPAGGHALGTKDASREMAKNSSD